MYKRTLLNLLVVLTMLLGVFSTPIAARPALAVAEPAPPPPADAKATPEQAKPVERAARDLTALEGPAKGEEAPATCGAGVNAAWPGPDGFGYAGRVVTYSWVDISTTGTAITGLGDDSFQGPLNIGFTFPFYGADWTQFYVGSNGLVTFGAGSTSLSNQCPLPNSSAPNNLLALLWDDLNFNVSGNAYYQNFAVCPVGNSVGCTVISYHNVAHYGGTAGSAGTWQAILYADGVIRMQFLDSGVEMGSGSTTGIEGNNFAAGHGLTFACDLGNSIPDELAIEFAVSDVVLTVSKQAPGAVADGVIPYTIVIKNAGSGTAEEASMEDPIPAGTSYVPGSVSATGGVAIYDDVDDAIYWYGDLGANEEVMVTFSVTLTDATCGGEVTNTATVFYGDDELTATATTTTWEYEAYASDFEANNGGFSGQGSWAWGVVGPYGGTRPEFPAGANSGTKAWATNLTGDYGNSENIALTSPLIDLSPLQGTTELSWWQWLRTEGSYDFASVQVRGGGTDWTTIYGPVSGIINLQWTRYAYDLSAFAGASDFQVRFLFTSDSSITYPGWYVDDVAIYSCAPVPGLYLGPNMLEASGCNGEEQIHTLTLANWTGEPGDFDLSYVIDPVFGTLTGPASLTLNEGQTQAFDVILTPALCLPNQVLLEASVTAAGNGYSDTSYIEKRIVTGAYWASKAAMTAPGLYDHAVVDGGDGGIYALGGNGIGTALNFRYDIATNTWAARANIPGDMRIIDAGQIGGVIYIPGGYDGAAFATTHRAYNTATDTWVTGAAAPRPVAGYGVAVCGNKLYRVGGTELATWPNGSTGAEVYDPATNAWTTLAPMTTGRTWPIVGCIANKLYVAGGLDAGGNDTNKAEVYDIAANTWSDAAMADLPATWWGAGFFVGDGLLYVAGGIRNGESTAQVVVYNPATDTWGAGPDLQDVRFRMKAASGYVIGGMEPVWTGHPTNEYLDGCPVCNALGTLQGHVYDYDGAMTPCQDATVSIQPGNIQAPVDGSGFYTVDLVPFDYEVSASATAYPEAAMAAVTIVEGQTLTQNFVLTRPDIEVSPMSFSESLIAPSSVTRQLNIGNLGTYPLSYEIFEVDLTRSGVNQVPPYVVLERKGAVEVDPQALAELDAEGTTDFFVQLRAEADLSAAYTIKDWTERGWYVYNALQAAAKAQAPIIAFAQARGLTYQTFAINNSVLLYNATLDDLNQLATRGDVYRIRANRVYVIGENTPQEDEPRTVYWNMDQLDPNAGFFGMAARQVWEQFDIRGEGIVVANIDTGAFYQHVGLDRQYRGNLTGNIGGPYNHDYNWYMPTSGCGDGTYPCDNNGHGSGTVGIMVGETPDMVEQVGAAPAAQWISCKGCEANSCSDAALTGCANWMVAPTRIGGADPNPAMRPHIVNNSWGGDGCDNWYQSYINAWRAAGIFPAFSAGNTTACSAVGSPGDNPGAFGTAAHSSAGLNQYAGGPSCYYPNPSCDPDAHEVDPHLNAPTFGRTTGSTQGAYYNLSGTSGASPHTAGCVALMWAANPSLIGDMDTTFRVLEQTADRTWTDPRNQGNCGKPACAGSDPYPNYEYGWGYLDCLAAVEAVYSPDVPWLSVSPITGTVGSGGSHLVDVTFTCTITDAQQAQPLMAQLQIRSNDPCESRVNVDVELYCTGQDPFPTWEKEVAINGMPASPVVGPHTIRPGDIVVVTDYVGAAFSENITATLTETWGDALALVSYDAGGVGAVMVGANSLTWTLTDVAPNTMYPIVKTFEVLYGVWTTEQIVESYTVAGEAIHLNDVIVAFNRYQPAMTVDKSAPAGAYSGDTVPIQIIINSSGSFRGEAHLTDALPTGMTYVPGTLVADYGHAWEDANVIHWTNITPTRGLNADIMVGVLSPDSDAMADFVAMINGFAGISAQRIPGDLGTMTLAQLLPYDVIVTSNNNQWSAGGGNPNIGNILADYVDAGGKIAMSQFVWDNEGWELTGRLMSQGYTPFGYATGAGGAATLGTFDNGHPIMQGVSSLAVSGTYGHMIVPTTAGAQWVASWSTGRPLIYTQGNAVVGFNFLYEWADAGYPWTGDGARILENSINWLVSQMSEPMPAEITLTFNAVVTGAPGDIIENVAHLDWGTDWTDDMAAILILEPSAVTVLGFGANAPLLVGLAALSTLALGVFWGRRKRRA